MERPPRKSTARELVEASIEGGVGMVPIVGSPLAVAFGLALGWTYNRRMSEWLEHLAAAVDELQQQLDEPMSFDALSEGPAFVDAVVDASRAAQATHQQDKLDALRNAVLNASTPQRATVDQQARFFRLVDEFTATHLLMLKFLESPVEWFDARNLDKPNLMAGGRARILEIGVPEFAGRRDWYDLIAGDIQSAGLANPNLHTVATGSGVWASGLTVLGSSFMAFISDPRGDGRSDRAAAV